MQNGKRSREASEYCNDYYLIIGDMPNFDCVIVIHDFLNKDDDASENMAYNNEH